MECSWWFLSGKPLRLCSLREDFDFGSKEISDMKKVLAVTTAVLMAVVVLSVVLLGAVVFVSNHFYSRVAYVEGFAPESDRVVFVDTLGHYWIMDGIEDWMAGNMASLIMYDSGTDKIFDDQIIRVTYQGSRIWSH